MESILAEILAAQRTPGVLEVSDDFPRLKRLVLTAASRDEVVERLLTLPAHMSFDIYTRAAIAEWIDD